MTVEHGRLVFVASGYISLLINWSLGLFVYSRNRTNPVNRLFGLFALTVGGWSVGSSLENSIADETSALWVLRGCYVFAAFLPTLFVHFSAQLTERRLARRAAGWLWVTSMVFAALSATDWFIPRLRTLEVYSFRLSAPGPAYYAFVAFFSGCLGAGLWWLFRTMRQAQGHQRRQLQYVLISHVIAVCAGFEYFSRVFGIWEYPPVDDYILVIYFLIFTYAIVRHQLLDIRIILRRSLVYSGLIACITAAYLVMILVMEHWFQGFFGYRSVLATLLVAFITALFFNPLREQIQTVVDRALFKATPAELAAQREQLLVEVRKGEQMKAVGTLAAGLAHEIRNPLTSIKTFTDHLGREGADPAFREKFQRIVGPEIDRINKIVQDLLEFAKPAAPKLESVDLCRLMDETLELLSSEIVARGVIVVREYAAQEVVLGDAKQLKQVFLNMLLNSFQAMNGNARLVIRSGYESDQVWVSITDNGAGIAPEHLARLGEPFFSTKPTGTGLGLAVVQSILHEHQGRLAIQSQVGRGTTITIHIPLAAS